MTSELVEAREVLGGGEEELHLRGGCCLDLRGGAGIASRGLSRKCVHYEDGDCVWLSSWKSCALSCVLVCDSRQVCVCGCVCVCVYVCVVVVFDNFGNRCTPPVVPLPRLHPDPRHRPVAVLHLRVNEIQPESRQCVFHKERTCSFQRT